MAKNLKKIKSFKMMSYEPAIMHWSCKPKIYSDKLSTSKEVFDFVYKYFNDAMISFTEQFLIIFLNRGNKIIGVDILSKGGKYGTVVDISIIVGKAAITNCSSVVFVHNHPSGNLKPSAEDKNLTSKCIKALKLLDIIVLDHLIVAEGNYYYSFADEGILN